MLQGGSEDEEAAGVMEPAAWIPILVGATTELPREANPALHCVAARRKVYRNWETYALFRGGLEGSKQESLKQG